MIVVERQETYSRTGITVLGLVLLFVPAGPTDVGHPTSGRDFFSTHFDINYLPENQARTEALWETSENGGRAAYDDGRRVTFVARFCRSRGSVFSRGERVETRTLLCLGVEGQILSVSDMGMLRRQPFRDSANSTTFH